MREVLGRIRSETPRWSLNETAKNLVELQGAVIDLSGVLRTHMPAHVHYRPNWFPGQTREPDSFRQSVSEYFDWKSRDPYHHVRERYQRFFLEHHLQEAPKETKKLYEKYFGKLGIKPAKTEIFRPKGRYQIVAFYAPTRWNRNRRWSPQTSVALFPWIDFLVEFDMGRRTVSPENIPLVVLNTTRQQGNLYRVEVEGSEGRNKDELYQFITGELIGSEDWIPTRESQKMITDFLASRIPDESLH